MKPVMHLHSRHVFLAGLVLSCLFLTGCHSAERTLFSEGEDEIRQLEWTRAYATFTRYIELYPRIPEGYFNRGLAAMGMGRLAMAMEDFDRVVQLDPTTTSARWMRYKIRAQHRASLQKTPPTDPLFRPMQQTMESAETELLLQELDVIIKIDPFDITACYERGSLLRSLGRYEEAKRDLDVVLLNEPDDVWALNERGRLMHDLRDYASAIRDYDAALSNCDSCTWLLYNKALSLSANGQPEEAVAVLSTLVGIDSLDAGAWLMLGECNATLGRRTEACAAFTRSMTLGLEEARARFDELCR